jgi:ubiquitin carboxyl-terminal hydrolase L5
MKELPSEPELLKGELANLEQQINFVDRDIQMEKEKYENWKVENIRRRHNYIPFIVNFLKILAEKGKLSEFLEKSKKAKK